MPTIITNKYYLRVVPVNSLSKARYDVISKKLKESGNKLTPQRLFIARILA